MHKIIICGIFIILNINNVFAQTPQIPSGSPNTTTESSNELDSRQKILKFIEQSASVAGAAAVCKPEVYTEIQLCSILITSHWGALGNSPNADKDIANAMELTWEMAAGKAREMQINKNAPLQCKDLISKINGMNFWTVCNAAREIQKVLDLKQSKILPQKPLNNRPDPKTGENFQIQ